MRLYVERGGSARGVDSGRSVVVSIDDPAATIGDLSDALGFEPGDVLSIDGFLRDPTDRLRDVELVEGSHVAGAAVAGAAVTALAEDDDGYVWLGVSGGPGTGTLFRGSPGSTLSVGRDAANDLHIDNTTVSTRHVALHIGLDGSLEIEDLGSKNGTWLSGRSVVGRSPWDGEALRVGSSWLSVLRVDRRDRLIGSSAAHADRSGRILVNRPPRSTGPSSPGPISLPPGVEERTNPTLAVLSLLAPLAFAAIMVVALGSWRYAFFGLLSPVMAFGNWLSGRRAVKKKRQGDATAHESALDGLRRHLAEAELLERNHRCAVAPNTLEIRRRIELPTRELWERRQTSFDAMVIRLGIGTTPWEVAVEPNRSDPSAEALAVLESARRLAGVEVLADLGDGSIGFVGDQRDAMAAIRSVIVQLCTHHGPADLRLAVLTTPERRADWSWVEWLPQSMAHHGAATLVGESAHGFATALLASPAATSTETGGSVPYWVVLVDDVELLHGRSSPVRRILELDGFVYGIVLTERVDQLPSSTSTIVEIEDSDGLFTLHRPSDARFECSGGLDLVSFDVAHRLARSLARFEDPESSEIGGALPRVVVGKDVVESATSNEIRNRWDADPLASALKTTIGIGERGPFSLDLVADGPHALVAGTTGSGKSELLRSLVLGLALNHSPDAVVFVLIDYKGGSAFDRCTNLPHVVGVVTDLDEHLAERALQSLQAELDHRERLLRSANAGDIGEYRRSQSLGEPLPRLVVVIDEFATLRVELPEFVASLVSIAQRGRSLGVHLVLATQRPSGAIDANIRANTNVRISLRVQSSADSIDVIDNPVAARIDRLTPGRAFVRRGEGDLAVVQTAWLSNPLEGSGPPVRVVDQSSRAVEAGVVELGPVEPLAGNPRTELDVLVDLVIDAVGADHAPRRPWLDALPGHAVARDLVELDRYSERDDVVSLAVGDEPSKQRRVRRGWDPSTGHLSVTGVLGSGVTSTLRTVIARLAAFDPNRPVWVFAADHAGGGLAGIDGWSHVSCCLEPTEAGRHARLIDYLTAELDRRRAVGAQGLTTEPLLVLAIDGIGAFVDAIGAEVGTPGADTLARLGRDGPALGVVMVLGAVRAGEVPRPVRSLIRAQIILEQSDVSEYAIVGIRPAQLPTFVPGRALWSPDAMVCQVVSEDVVRKDLPAELDEDDRLERFGPPPRIDELAEMIDRNCLAAASVDPHLLIPIGIAEATRETAMLSVRGGEHVTIAGPPSSGRTSALRLLAAQLRAGSSQIVLVGVNPLGQGGLLDDPSLDAGGALADIEHLMSMALDDDRRWVILVDDADRIDVVDGPLVELVWKPPAHVTVMAAVRSSAGRTAHGHWTRSVHSSGIGLLLSADNAVDGDLLGVRLPRHVRLRQVPGRGYLVGPSQLEAVQVAL